MTQSVAIADRAATRPAMVAGLPRWPVLLMVAGTPLWWVLGLSPFMPAVFAFIMMALLLTLPSVRLVPGALPLVLFALWCPASIVMLDSSLRFVGFIIRWSAIVAAATVLVYVTNSAADRLRDTDLLAALAVLWAFVVLGGYLGMFWPEARLTTPMAHLLPSVVLHNEFVNDLVMPRLAEVQRPYGAVEPFNRPAAPFPYTNGWGCALALLTPIVATLRDRVSSPGVRRLLLVGVAASVVPAVQTANRGMLLVLAVEIAWFLGVHMIRGDRRKVRRILAVAGAAVAAMAALGAFDLIANRQAVSDTTTGRASIYVATLTEAKRSPILGFGAPRPSPEIGIALGTQGAIWMYLFAYGAIGAGLFLVFLLGVISRTSALSADHAWLGAVLVGAFVACWFYGFDAVHLSIIAVTSGVLLRSRTQALELGRYRGMGPARGRAWR